MSDERAAKQKLCPNCGEPSLSDVDGVLGCRECGWCEEDDPEDLLEGSYDGVEPSEHPPRLMAVVDYWQEAAAAMTDRACAAVVEEVLMDIRRSVAPQAADDVAMALLPNDKHPGPGCSCRECLRAYPDLPVNGSVHPGTASR